MRFPPIAGGKPPASSPTVIRSLPLFVLSVVAVLLLATRLRRRFIRYEISGESMLPTLRPGDFVIVDRRPHKDWRPSRGDIVLARDPRERERTLVKRVSRCEEGDAWLLGDNPDSSTDSRTFGALPREYILGEVRWRYWPLNSGPRLARRR